jgi:hypothetical protein
VQIGDNRAAEWVRRSNPVALGLLFSGLAGHTPLSRSVTINAKTTVHDSPGSSMVLTKARQALLEGLILNFWITRSNWIFN